MKKLLLLLLLIPSLCFAGGASVNAPETYTGMTCRIDGTSDAFLWIPGFDLAAFGEGYGPELAVNVFNNSGSYDWDTFSGASASGFTGIEDTTLGRAIAYATFTPVVGALYLVSFDIVHTNPPSVSVGYGVNDFALGSGGDFWDYTLTSGTIQHYFVSSGDNYYGFRVEAGTTADIVVSNFSVREVRSRPTITLTDSSGNQLVGYGGALGVGRRWGVSW